MSKFAPKAPTLQELLEKVFELVPTLLQKMAEVSLEGLARVNSAEVDKQILATERQYGYKYVGGQIKIAWVDGTRISEHIELYYQDGGGNWLEVKSGRHYLPVTALEPSSRVTLQTEGEVVFDIPRPLGGAS